MLNPRTTKENGMFLPLLVVMACTSSLFAQDISVSKDSLWVYNSIISSKADAVIFTSESSAPINLDSVRIVVEEIDTTGLPAGQRMEAAWSANSAMNPFFTWYLEKAGNNEYLLSKGSFLPSGVEMPLSFEKTGDSSRIFKFSIGYCLIPACRPLYPRYFRGKLKLFFSNSQIVAIRLYSDDLREKTPSAPRRGSITTCLFRDSLDFSLINDSCQKRITAMETCTFNTCSVATPDVRITVNSILAPQGVLFLGTSSDTGCLDTLKRVPQAGYLDSVGFGYSGGYLFAVKTSEMNYAAFHLITSGSGLPFRYFKWVYQSDGSPQFIKETSAKTATRKMTTNLRHVESILKRGKVTVSWAPLPGAVQINLFDLNGRQLYAWEADGRQGTAVVPVKYSKLPSSTLILHLQMRNRAKTGQVGHIIMP
jgi:hypothetical protein